MHRVIIVNGSHMVLRCPTCSSLSVVTVDALKSHWAHLPSEARVLVLGQLELSGLDDAFRNDARVGAATQWLLQQPVETGEIAALAALAGVHADELPHPLDVTSRRLLSARAEIRRAEVVHATRRAKADSTSVDELRELVQHEVAVVRNLARETLARRASSERAPLADQSRLSSSRPEPEPEPLSMFDQVCQMAGLHPTGERLHDGGATHWVVEDPRPIVGGRYVLQIGEAGDDAVTVHDLRAMLWTVDDLDAIRGIVVAERFTDEARGFAARGGLQLVDLAEVDTAAASEAIPVVQPAAAPAPAASPSPLAALDTSMVHPAGIQLEVDLDATRAHEPAASSGESAFEATAELDLADQLVRSPMYLAQRVRAGRGALDDDIVTTIVRAALAHDGRVTLDLLALRLLTTPASVRVRVANLRRILNVDGYEIVRFEDDDGSVALDEELLRAQFTLSGRLSAAGNGTGVPPYVQS